MDGYDFEFNWKLLNSYQDSCQYISLIDEMIESKTDESLIFDMVTRDQVGALLWLGGLFDGQELVHNPDTQQSQS